MKLVSWNVNGVRSVIKKDFAQSFINMNTDILCLQETKAQDDQVVAALAEVNGYFVYTNSAERKGYSGTAVLTREEPENIILGMGVAEHDKEGRVITADFNHYYLVTVYTPNSGSELKRLDYRQQWDLDFLQFLKQLEKSKPVIVCGDLNVAHTEIDIARPKQNYNKSAGYMQEEIDGITNILNNGFIDTFRYSRGPEIKYSWWSFRAGARQRNIGWRIDYFLTSEALKDSIVDADIHPEVMGSDHCPVSLTINK